jgi:hypothetical protein
MKPNIEVLFSKRAQRYDKDEEDEELLEYEERKDHVDDLQER